MWFHIKIRFEGSNEYLPICDDDFRVGLYDETPGWIASADLDDLFLYLDGKVTIVDVRMTTY
jgi:hypothetical protein